MTTPSLPTIIAQARAEFEELIKDIRPELHRYAARMVGSVIDGEDVVQEALAKAYYALASLPPESNLRGWLFRITHNKAIDHLRRHYEQSLEQLDEQPMTSAPDVPLEDKELTAVALSLFLKLAPKQRSCVILKDVLGYSLAEISELLDATVPAIKAALHRGRTRLRELAESVEVDTPPSLDEPEQALLSRYIDRFNARDFEAVRDLLADEVRLDLVGRAEFYGAAEISGNYFYNYKQLDGWHFDLGWIENQPAILVYTSPEGSRQPAYFILITGDGSHVTRIRDYRYANYVMQDATISVM